MALGRNQFSNALTQVYESRKKKDEEEKTAPVKETTSAEAPVSSLKSLGGSGMVQATGTAPQTIQTPALDAARGNTVRDRGSRIQLVQPAGMVNATGVKTGEDELKQKEQAYKQAQSALQMEAMSGMASAETAAAAEKARQEYQTLKDKTEKTDEEKAVDKFRQERAELQMAAQAGGLASADTAAKAVEAEDKLREMGIATEQRYANTLAGASGRVQAGLANALATGVDAAALTESVKNAYDPLTSAVTGGDADKYIRSLREETHEGMKPVYEAADRWSEQAAADLDLAKKGLGNLGKAAVDLAENVIEMGFDSGVGLLTGGGALGSMFLRVLGNAEQEARQNGATLEQQLAYGLTTAGIELLTEKVSGIATKWAGYGAGGADEFTEKLIAKLAKTDTGRTAMRVMFGLLSEGGEETLSRFLSPFADAIWKTDENGNPIGLGQLYKQLITPEGLAEGAYEFIIGGIIGALGAGTNIITGSDAQSNRALREMEAAQPQLNNAEASQPLSGSDAMAQVLSGQENAQTEAEAPAMSPAEIQVRDILSGEVSNSKAEQILNDPDMRAAFEQMSGQPLGGSKSEQRAQVKAFAEQMRTEAQMQAEQSAMPEAEAPTTPLAEAILQNEQTEAPVQEIVPPEGMLRSRSEENTIQAIDEQLGAPEEVRNPLFYTPVTEAESMAAARNYLENGYESTIPPRESSKVTPEQQAALSAAGQRLGGGYAQAIADLQGQGAWNGVQQDMSTEMLAALAKDAAATGNWDAYEAWRVVDQEHGTEIARTLQARGKRTRGIADTLNATAEYIQTLNLSKEARDAVMTKVLPYAERLQNISETDAESLRQFITDIAEQRNTGTIIPGLLGKLLAKQDAAYLAKMAQASVKSFSADSVPVDVGAKIKSYQTIAQLLKATTFMRNLLGNETFGFMDALVGDTAGQVIDALVSTKTGAASVPKDLRWFDSTQRKAAVDAMQKSALEIALDLDMGSVGTKYDPSRRAYSMSGNAAERFMSRLSQILSYSLTSSDRFFRGGIEAGTVEELNRLNEGNEEALAQSEKVAENLADYRLFQNESKAAQVSKQGHDILNGMLGIGGQTSKTNPAVPKGQRRGGWGLGDLIMPYATVPANLAVKAFEYSPAGIIKGGIDLAKVLKDADSGKLNLSAQNKAVMEIARGTTGVPLAILFASLIKSGIMKRSDDDKDYDVTKARQTEGLRETQWNLDATLRWLSGGGRDWKEGDKLISLNWAEPINAFMDIGALFADAAEDGDATISDYASKYVGGAIQSFMEMPMIEGLQNAVQSVQRVDSDNWQEKAGKFAENTATSAATGMVPGLISQLARTLDPVTRDTSADTASGRLANALLNTLPGLRERLPEKMDSFAQPIKNDNQLLNALNNFALPGTINEYAPDDVVQALDDVYAETGKSSFYPDYKAPNSVNYGKQDYTLTTEEKRAWQTSFGERYAELVRATIDSPQYKQMDADTKAKVFGEIRSAASAEAKGTVVTGRGDEFKSDYDKILGLSDIPGYLATKARYADAVESKDYGEMDSILEDYGKLPEDVKEQLDSGTTQNLDKLYSATQNGATAESWFKASDAVSALKPLEGNKEVKDWQKAVAAATASPEYADAILEGYLDEGPYKKYKAAREMGASVEAWSKTYEAANNQTPPAGKEEVQNWQKIQAVIDTEPEQASALMAAYLDGPDYTKFLMDTNRTGLSAVDWGKAYVAAHSVTPLEGKDQAANWQKYAAIVEAMPDQADKALQIYMAGSSYSKYKAARDAGATAQEWANAYSTISKLQPYAGASEAANWQKYEAIVENYPNLADKLMPAFMDDGTLQRYQTGRDFGVSPELITQFYRQKQFFDSKDANGETESGLKKKRLMDWVVAQGYSEKQAEYMYKLFSANLKDLPGLNAKYGR